jgi:aryl-alcohol dehydrogenase-like predicted oxidoreductase
MRLTGRDVPADRIRSIEVLRRAVEFGVNHIDTAAFYFSPLRSANELIGAALAPFPDDLVIVTKVGPGRDPSGEWYSARPDQLREAGLIRHLGVSAVSVEHLDEALAIAPSCACRTGTASTSGSMTRCCGPAASGPSRSCRSSPSQPSPARAAGALRLTHEDLALLG